MKAFHRVDHDYIFKCLQKMNFPNYIINIKKCLYKEVTSKVKINGFLTKILKLLKGLRQGCPLSRILYIIAAEILNILLKTNKKILGPTSTGNPFISQYADDTAVATRGDKSIHALFDTLKIYEKATGAKVNLSKTEGLWLGINNNRLKLAQREMGGCKHEVRETTT